MKTEAPFVSLRLKLHSVLPIIRSLSCIFVLILSPLKLACSNAESDQAYANRKSDFYDDAPEVDVIFLPLGEPLSLPDSEMSALTWCQDELLIVPQYPDFLADAAPALYTLNKADVLASVTELSKNSELSNAASSAALKIKKVPLEGNELLELIDGYEGIEAAVCSGQELILAIETNQLGPQEATVLVGAQYTGDRVVIESVGASLLSPTKLSNKGNEALVQTHQGLLSLHEVNDSRLLNYRESAYFLPSYEDTEAFVSVADIPYRVTDATVIDSKNRFWVINYQYQRDTKLVIENDVIWKKHGIGRSHRAKKQVERLVELQFDGDSVTLTDTPPIQLQLEGTNGHNWEGIARLDELGFLIVTDKHPRSLLGFVPFNTQ